MQARRRKVVVINGHPLTLSVKKSVLEPVRLVEFLGVELDFVDGRTRKIQPWYE